MSTDNVQMTTEQENDLICEKLLGWRFSWTANGKKVWWHRDGASYPIPTPSFLAWVTAGIILDRFHAMGLDFALFHDEGKWLIDVGALIDVPWTDSDFERGPNAIRTAALLVIPHLGNINGKNHDQVHNVPENRSDDGGSTEGGS